MILKKLVWFGMFSLLFFWGCNDCEECETTVSAPRASFVFINQTALDTLNTNLAEVDMALEDLQASAAIVNAANVTLDSLLDSLTARIGRGMIELREDSTATANKIVANNETLATNTAAQTSLNTERTEITSTISTVESGDVLVDTVTNLLTGNALTFTDSATVYQLPLDPNLTEMSYGFSIAAMEYDITVTYVTTTSQNARRNVVVGAESITYTATSFDSVRVDPESDNTHATAIIYCNF